MTPHSRRAGQPRPIDLAAFADQVAKAAGAPAPRRPPTDEPALDARGYARNGCTAPGHNEGRAPANKGKHYPPDPPTVAEVMGMLRSCPQTPFGDRTKAAITLLYQASLRAREALGLELRDLDRPSGRIIVRHGKGNKTAAITMAAWAWPLLDPWLARRAEYPPGAILCVIDGPTAGRAWGYADLTRALKKTATAAGVTRRMSAHQLRHAWAVHEYRRGVDLKTIQRHLRHENVGITDRYLGGVGADESLATVFEQTMPTVPASALLELAAVPA